MWEDWLQHAHEKREEKYLQRSLTVTDNAVKPVVRRNGKRLINFSSNNYLGLADHPDIKKKMIAAVDQGAGATSSRLIIGHGSEIEQLEQEVAHFHGKEAALVIANGYMANLGVLSTLLSPQDAVFSDQYNHASIVDGIRLSGAKSFRYRHLNMDHLEKMLKRAQAKGYQKKLIITDTVFSMDGDWAPLNDLIMLKRKYDAALVVDEAHGVGVWGMQGQGLAHHLGTIQEIDLLLGTFSKAFGVYGAYVAGSKLWIDYLVNQMRSLIYTTGLPPTVIAGIRAALKQVQAGTILRSKLHSHYQYFHAQLRRIGFHTGLSQTQIIPIYIGENQQALQLSHQLFERGILAVPIRPPTVPVGEARLRFSLMASHEQDHLTYTLDVLEELWKKK
ncbi:8-amino-7-oxononanoate synthase [Hazenella sp. IB182357]|uniref:8-amino-7-ketopelargonate synthase n=1 Tax=Polycladospora coralii TaxID=2771432 RepID=A0A926RUM3_9BACL|nr:8-amino-7-oxononanoate synthase [Polycladospora coralii]MBD1372539.1 8-amino-7-oxononanoate synthase [Polycladospora coralii]